MKKYPSIRYPGESATDGLLEPGEDIVVMEKLDGANFRFKFEDGELVVGSRNVEYESADDRTGARWRWATKEHPLSVAIAVLHPPRRR